MTLEKFVADDRVFVRQRDSPEKWIVVKDGKKYRLDHAAYVSVVKYKEIEENVSSYKDSLDKDDASDLIDDAREEKHGLPGGYVIFFIGSGDLYKMHARQIKKIEEI